MNTLYHSHNGETYPSPRKRTGRREPLVKTYLSGIDDSKIFVVVLELTLSLISNTLNVIKYRHNQLKYASSHSRPTKLIVCEAPT